MAPVFVWALGSAAWAADTYGRFAIEGAGLATCDRFLAAIDEQSTDVGLYASWMEGYVTALNQTRDGIYDLTPWQGSQTMVAALATACRGLESDSRVIVAANLVVDLMAGSALTREAAPMGLTNGSARIVIYDRVLEMARTALDDLGFASDDPAGEFGQSTLDAFTAYQASIDIAETGLPDQRTLSRLLPLRVAPEP